MIIELGKNFKKKFKKIENDKIKKSIKERIYNLPDGDVKKLEGIKNNFRLRVGNYRIIFIREKDKIIVINIDTRENIYK